MGRPYFSAFYLDTGGRLGVDCGFDLLHLYVIDGSLLRIRGKRNHYEGGIYDGKGFDCGECVCREGCEL